MVSQQDEIAVLRTQLDELLAYAANVPADAKTPRGKRFEVVRIKAIVTLALHTHRLGRAVATLLDAGYGIEAGPTVTSVLDMLDRQHPPTVSSYAARHGNWASRWN
ncbi:MAG: hypothetical protein ACRDRK_13260 [Pseudonocardia sp.]